jgi:CubicO group peptidase (beta-lactamase class C family)
MRRLLALCLALLPVAAAAAPAPVDPLPAGLVPPGFSGVIVIDRGKGVVTIDVPEQAASGRVWRWASVTKQVAAVLVMQEVARGRIALDAPVSRYLPGIVIPGGDAVTVRRLLNHSSGLFDPEDGLKDALGRPLAYLRSGPTPTRGLDPACLAPSGRPVGEFRYNNCAYVVTGALLEKVTGQRFAALVAARIAGPLKLTSLRVLPPGAKPVDSGRDAEGNDDADIDVGRYGPAGNLVGTAQDMAAFGRALLDGRLLPATAKAEMWRGDPALGYAALGQWSFPAELAKCPAVVPVVERRGAIGNVQVRHLILPSSNSVVVMITDNGSFDFGEIWQGKGPSHDVLNALVCPGAPL